MTSMRPLSLSAFVLAAAFELALDVTAHAQLASIEIATWDGKSIALSQASISGDWRITGRQDGNSVGFDAADLLSMRFASRPPTRIRGMRVLFPTAELIVCRQVTIEGDQLLIRSPLFAEVKAPLATITGLVLDADAAESQIDMVGRLAVESGSQGDLVLLKNGDRITCGVASLDADNVGTERDGKSVPLPRAGVAAVLFDPSLIDYPRTTGFFAQVTLSDGSVFNARRIANRDSKLICTPIFGGELELDEGSIVEVSFRNGRVVYLSDLKPTATILEPYLDDPPVFQNDRNALGGPLQLGDRTYSKGIGVRPRSRLTYDVAQFSRFDAIIGLDVAAGPSASVGFMVECDGKAVFNSGEMHAMSAPKKISVPLAGAKRLTLVADFARRGDVQDFANWCDARLVRDAR